MNPPPLEELGMKKPEKRGGSCIGKIFLAGIGMSIALMGLIFCLILYRTYARAVEMQKDWARTTAYVMVSEVRERRISAIDRPEYSWNLSYRYEYKDKQLFGDHFTLRENAWSSTRERAEESCAKYAVGSEVPCYVNPANPSQAVLKLESKAAGYTLWFPGLFLAGGCVLTFRAIRGRRA